MDTYVIFHKILSDKNIFTDSTFQQSLIIRYSIDNNCRELKHLLSFCINKFDPTTKYQQSLSTGPPEFVHSFFLN